ncbi:sugar transferase [Paenibacillus sp. RC67]|uniref:sugar transferase n=1 Tax=Paenibacillus sp. RC67 TaxID=3039392 RepID=UPI0024ADB8BF|nr:sugar transferase [Paenibacillus sp. RC67]
MKPYIIVKKTTDFFFAAVLLVAVSPILLGATIAIKVESKGPILFSQKRPGKNCRIFTIFKFRTMRIETKKNGEPLSDMERMTRVGSFLRKTSIDELPQLFNILCGEMSFIGPRPLLIEYLNHYTPAQKRRHDVTPGISGWAQVNGRNTIGWDEKFQLDVWYVNHISFLLDMKILYMTICNVIFRKGINNSQGNTMPLFTGSSNDYNNA